MSIVSTLGAFLLTIAVIVVVHEFGHYLVARWCGVRVLRFSIGFGKPLVSRRLGRDQTEWVLGAVPLGGYVRFLDERVDTVDPDEAPRAFNRQNVWKRIAIVLAGPLANLLLAVVLYTSLYAAGIPGMKPLLAEPPASSVAQALGFARGDRLTAIDETPVQTWEEARWLLLKRAVDRGAAQLAGVTAAGAEFQRRLDFAKLDSASFERDFLRDMGLIAYSPELKPFVGRVLPGGAADTAGLKAGDEILGVEGREITRWDTFVDEIKANPDRTVRVSVGRAGQVIDVTLTPRGESAQGKLIGRIGAAPRFDEAVMKELQATTRYSLPIAVVRGVEKTWEMTLFSFKAFGKMIMGELSWRNLSGPVSIADYAGRSASSGLTTFITFLAMVSIGLGVLNLLPVPLLDGGHLLYYSVEAVTGKPISERVAHIGQQVGLALIIGLSLFALFNDIQRLIAGS